mgnify:FL=1
MRRGPAWAPINAPEDAVSRAREEKQIRTFFRRVKKVGPVTDTSAPRGYGLPHFQSNTKKIEDHMKWQNKISHENQILMKSIVHIMENGTPLSQKPDMARVRLRRNMAYNKAITDKIRKDELRKHNRYFAGRLRKTQATPSTSHASHAKFYEDQAYYRRNMGRAVRMKPLGKRASTGTVVTGESSVQDQEYAELRKIADSVDLTRETLKTPGLKLLTAKQIRDDTAKAHGYELLPEHSRMFLPIAMASALKAPKGDYGDRLRE